MLLATWIITTSLGIDYVANGNAQALIAPQDYAGRLCGVDSQVANKPYGYITAITDDGGAEFTCVKECPTKTMVYNEDKTMFSQLICQDEYVPSNYQLPKCGNSSDDDCISKNDDKYYFRGGALLGEKSESYYDADDRTIEDEENVFGTGPCMLEFASYSVGYYCVPDVDAKFPKIAPITNDVTSADFSAQYYTIYYGSNNKTIAKWFEDAAGSTSDGADIVSMLKQGTGGLESFISDVVICRDVIFGFGLGIAIIVALLYTKLLSMGLVTIIVWGCIVLTFIFEVVTGAFFYTEYTDWSQDDNGAHTDTEINGMLALSYIFFALAGLWVCFIWCIREKIALACAFVQIAGNAIRDMPILVFFPLIQAAGLILFLVPWTYYMVYSYAQGSYVSTAGITAGNGTADDDYQAWEFTAVDANSVWTWTDADSKNVFMMFSYFWTSQFIVAMGQLIMAMSFTLWYFAGYEEWAKKEAKELDAITTTKMETDRGEDKAGEKQESCCYKTLCKGHPYRGNALFFKGIWLSLYHVGTAAAGSLIIAIIKTIEYIVAKIQEKCNKNMTGIALKIANIILCCIQCCLYCLEKCMKFINKHAYIITAVKGESFCMAACSSFWLIARNIRLIAALTMVQEFCIIVGKIVICMATGALALLCMQNIEKYDNKVNSFIGPVIFVMILAYFIADMFMVVYSMVSLSLRHCLESHASPGLPGTACA